MLRDQPGLEYFLIFKGYIFYPHPLAFIPMTVVRLREGSDSRWRGGWLFGVRPEYQLCGLCPCFFICKRGKLELPGFIGRGWWVRWVCCLVSDELAEGSFWSSWS